MLTVDFFAALRAAATFLAGLPPGWAALIFTVHFSFTARAQVCGLIRYVPSSSPRRRGGGRSHKSCAFAGALTKISAGRSTRKGVRRIRKAAQRIRPAPRPRPPSLGLRPIHLEVLAAHLRRGSMMARILFALEEPPMPTLKDEITRRRTFAIIFSHKS